MNFLSKIQLRRANRRRTLSSLLIPIQFHYLIFYYPPVSLINSFITLSLHLYLSHTRFLMPTSDYSLINRNRMNFPQPIKIRSRRTVDMQYVKAVFRIELSRREGREGGGDVEQITAKNVLIVRFISG